jgi:hypothetical protein
VNVDAIESGAWRRRLRWRLRGAWTWPLFIGLTAAEAALIHFWPIAGDRTSPIAALLIAGFANWLLVAVAAPLWARWQRRYRRVSQPLEVVTDRAAAILMAGLGVLFVALAALNHGAVAATQREDAAMRAAVARTVRTRFRAYAGGLHRLDIDRPAPHLYRTCVPGLDPRRPLCMYVKTDQSPPSVTIDPDRVPNALVFGPGPPDR